MKRKLATVAQIREEIQRRIAAADLLPPCNECGAPAPIPLQQPDDTGCNWTYN